MTELNAPFLAIDLGAIADNYLLLKKQVGANCAVAGVVKTNAYGLGVQEVAQTLEKFECPQYFVATLDEALTLRSCIPNTPVAVLGAVIKGAEKEYFNHNITPILNSLRDIETWRASASTRNQKLEAIIHFDIGMNRLGLSTDESDILLDDLTLLEGLNITTIMSHFACADEKDHPLTEQQAHKFANIAMLFPRAYKSLANSSGIFRDRSFHYDMVRPGYALYGGNPTPETSNPMRPVVTLEAPVLQTRHVKKGQSVGYGTTHIFEQDTQTATIALGYGDGFLRSGSSKANVYYEGTACPVLGRVSMDLITIDIGHLEQRPQTGDKVEILGHHQSIDDLAHTMDTIGYEILTSLGTRYKRVYRRMDETVIS
ncbi:MAG: alanine racemase [Alphaproteobacteria bacterium]|nr:alanine racemase [Alphaproteobacteria bacterium]